MPEYLFRLKLESAQARTKARKALSGALPQSWAPLPGPQTEAYNSAADELFYGGAAGGGKTDLLLGLAGTAHRQSLIMRREFTHLRSIIERSREIYAGRYNESLHIWRLSGRIVEFGSLQYEKDKEDQRGRPHDFKGWDELPGFTESQYRFVNAWNRTTIAGQRTRVVATGNPPTTVEGEWIIRHWAPWLDSAHRNPALPGELRWFATIGGKDHEVESGAPFIHDGEQIIPRSRTFIPARVQDNPYLMETNYLATLNALPEPLRSQMLYGDFSVGVGEDPWQVIPTAWVLEAQQRREALPKPAVTLRSTGVDVARGGKDRTAIARLYGTWFDDVITYPGKETPDGAEVAQRVLVAVDDPTAPVCVDTVGYGASAYDHLRATNLRRVIPVNNGAGSSRVDKSGRFGFSNLRAESYWKLREALDPASGENICLPPGREVRVDLCSPRYKVVGGKIAIEPKDDIIKRTGHSPDIGDAIVLAWFGGYQTASIWLFDER